MSPVSAHEVLSPFVAPPSIYCMAPGGQRDPSYADARRRGSPGIVVNRSRTAALTGQSGTMHHSATTFIAAYGGRRRSMRQLDSPLPDRRTDGCGKSTLMLNKILHDIRAGRESRSSTRTGASSTKSFSIIRRSAPRTPSLWMLLTSTAGGF